MENYSSEYEVKINYDFLPLEDGIEDFKVFFKQVIYNFSEESMFFFNEWGEFPFVYREKQVNSALIPAIHKYTKSIFLEQPFKKNQDEQRFLDIVTCDKNNIYLIELKHAYNSNAEYINQRVDKEWITAIEQIKDINENTLGNQYMENYNLFKVALLIMPMFSSDRIYKRDINLENYHNQIMDKFNENAWEKVELAANLFGTIKINNPKKYVHEWSDKKEIYPFVSFIAKIEKV